MEENIENEDDKEIAFPEFESIEKLDKETILDEMVFRHIFAIKNTFKREKETAKIEARARELKMTRRFNNMYRVFKEMYIKELKSGISNITDFSNDKYKWKKGNKEINQLNCGSWIANDKGVWKEEKNAMFETTTIKASSIPIMPVERLINMDTNTEKVKLAFFKDGKWQDITVEKNTISTKTKILQLANRGIEVNENNAKNLIKYLADVIELNTFIPKKSVSHLGWADNEFVPFTEEYCLDVDKEFKQKLNSISCSGEYEKWLEHIKQLRKYSKTLRFMIATSFASVLVKIFKLNSFIVHLWGKSGNGKTVAEMVCASIWGRPDNNMISNLSNTTIANERLCNFYRNMPIILDELQIAKTRYKSFDEVVYTLTEGKGKERGSIDNGIREQTSWQTIIILNGEEPITSNFSKEGVKNRVIEINEDDQIIENGNKTVNLIQENYGFAGRKFIKLIEDREKLQKIQQKYINELSGFTEYKKQLNAYSIIMTADYIVSKNIFKDAPLTIKDIEEYFSKDTDEAERIYNLILDWFYQNINKFNNTSGTGEIWGKYDSEGENVSKIYIITKVLRDFLKENNISWDGIKRKLLEKEYIEKDGQGKFTKAVKINGTNIRCICINIIPKENDLQFENEYEYEQQEFEDLPF